jgi:prophage antirepressor-like protein
MKKNTTNERQNYQLTPFTFGNLSIRAEMINGEPWFVAKDVCAALGLGNPSETLNGFPRDERGIKSFDTLGGRQYLLTVNEPGLYRLIFCSRKKEAAKFKTWVFAEVLPQIRRTGAYTPGKPDAGAIYALFSTCPDMTIQRVNRLAYYFAVRPPLANADIARLLDVSDATVTHWRKRLSADTAREAVEALDINALGYTAANKSRADVPLALPEKEAANEPNE